MAPVRKIYTVTVMGEETSTDGAPSEIANARRSSVSASGPKITPISNRFKKPGDAGCWHPQGGVTANGGTEGLGVKVLNVIRELFHNRSAFDLQ